MTGSAVQWLRDQMKIIKTAAESEDLARSVDDNGGMYFVPAFSGLFAPYWRSDARGAIVGLARYNDNAHLARATLEAICYQSRDVAEAMEQDSGVHLDVLKVDGGVTANDLCMQIQADVLGVPVSRPVVAETTALGAAYAAGLATGFWRDTDELRTHWRESKRWQPQWSDDRRARPTPAGRGRWNAPSTGSRSPDRTRPTGHVLVNRASHDAVAGPAEGADGTAADAGEDRAQDAGGPGPGRGGRGGTRSTRPPPETARRPQACGCSTTLV
ncbi:Glycerol kinase [Streptomyces griseomycini]